MADKKITQLTELTTADANDFIAVVDVSDPTHGASGTTKKIQKGNLVPNLDFLSNDVTDYTNATLPLAPTNTLIVEQGGAYKKVAVSEIGSEMPVQVMGFDYVAQLGNLTSNWFYFNVLGNTFPNSNFEITGVSDVNLIDIGNNSIVLDKTNQNSYLKKIEITVNNHNLGLNLSLELVLIKTDDIFGTNQELIFQEEFITTNGILKINKEVNILVNQNKFITPFFKFTDLSNFQYFSPFRNFKLEFYAQ